MEDAQEAQIGVVAKETEGGHTWINWRDYLHEFATMLFLQRSDGKSFGATPVAPAPGTLA